MMTITLEGVFMNYNINDIVFLSVQHNCKNSNKWKILRIGADVRIKCLQCGKRILMTRYEFENRVLGIDENKNNICESSSIDNSFSDLKFMDTVILKSEYICKNSNNHLYTSKNNSWVIKGINNYEVELECVVCKQKLKMPRQMLEKIIITDKPFTKKTNNKNSLITPIEDNYDFQKKSLNQILKVNDIITLDHLNCCPNCKKDIFRIMFIPKNPNKSITLICDSCDKAKDTIYYNNQIYDDKLDTDSEKLYNTIGFIDETNLEYVCPNCGYKHSKIIKNIFDQNIQQISCKKCNSTKSFKIERSLLYATIKKLNGININQIYKDHKHPFNSLEHHTNRINIKNKTYSDIFIALQQEKITLKLQLIDSPNNHVTRNHKIQNVKITIPFKRKNENNISILTYICHYCKNCNIYFDFYHSFIEQLHKENLEISNLIAYITLIDENGNNKSNNINAFQTFNSESLLHTLGYKVGHNGKTAKQRQNLLKIIFDQQLLSIAEMKATINHNINLFSKRKEYSIAINDWKKDLNFLNSLIKEHLDD